jgi:hypothetical protein
MSPLVADTFGAALSTFGFMFYIQPVLMSFFDEVIPTSSHFKHDIGRAQNAQAILTRKIVAACLGGIMSSLPRACQPKERFGLLYHNEEIKVWHPWVNK